MLACIPRFLHFSSSTDSVPSSIFGLLYITDGPTSGISSPTFSSGLSGSSELWPEGLDTSGTMSDMSIIPEFSCALCGSKHASPGKDEKPRAADADASRSAWHKICDHIASLPDDAAPLTVDSFIVKEIRLFYKYAESLSSNSWKFPDTLDSAKGPSGFFLRCKDGCKS